MRDVARPPAILIAHDDAARRGALRRALDGPFETHCAAGAAQALAVFGDEFIHVVLAGGARLDAEALLAEIAGRAPETARIALAEAAPSADLLLSEGAGAEALRKAAGAAARLFHLRRETERLALEATRLRRGAPRREPASQGFERLVRAPGSPLDAVCREAAAIAAFDVPALILGETGVGKELLARAIHDGSLRSDRPFVAVNCGAIPDTLLESELFGHRKGAFTGAEADRVGLLEACDGGAVFLDEIGDTSAAFQVKLLRFLQEGEIRPVGANETRRVDVRVIAATNRDLRAEAESGGFRADLYWRLAVAPLSIPPLRARPRDVAPLAEALLLSAMEAHGKTVRGIAPAALGRLAAHDWPGNVRELENEITRLLMRASGDWLAEADLSPQIGLSADVGAAFAEAPEEIGGSLKDRVERLEADVLRETLFRTGGNKSRAAELLGLSRVGLRAKLDRYGLEAPSRLAAE